MARTRYTAEEIIGQLRTIEIELGKGLAVVEACRKLGITEQTYYRWQRRTRSFVALLQGDLIGLCRCVRRDVDADDGMLGIQPADEELSSRSSPAKSGLRTAAAATEVVSGDEGGTARFSRTSVTGSRYRVGGARLRQPLTIQNAL